MPYISPAARLKFQHILSFPIDIANAGELNYLISAIANEYLMQHGRKYHTMNDISGAFTNALNEFQTRIQRPYEDEKIKENGDVYDIV